MAAQQRCRMTSNADDMNPVPFDWKPLFWIKRDIWFGVSRGQPCLGDRDRPIGRLEGTDLIGLLPLLERDYLTVLRELTECEQEHALPDGSMATILRLAALPHIAFDMASVYWMDLALDWCMQMPIDLVDRTLLDLISAAPWATQRVAHKAVAVRRARFV